LIGTPVEQDGKVLLVDKDENICAVVTAKQGIKPVYVSIGHMVSLDSAIEIVKHCSKKRIPEPLLQAHKLATEERIRLAQEGKVNNIENQN
jgi:deoxyribonuclease V